MHAYTSPHLVRFHERINLATSAGTSADISENYLVETLEEVVRINDGAAITFFEMTTAAGFLSFSRIPADYLILEVGLGGRFDTTNVLDKSTLSIITPISIDHVQFLGDKITIAKVNIDENPNTHTIYGVRGIPTMLIFKDGELAATKVGALPKGKIAEWIEENV